MADKTICPICKKRRAERYCPAKGEKICAVDCGKEREVTIDCPVDCSYLIAAHRWEEDHPKPLTESDLPFPDIDVSEDLVHTRQYVLSGFVYTVEVYASEQRPLDDSDVLSGVQALAETYRTLVSGIYYEKPPEAPLAAGVYAALTDYIADERKHAGEDPEFPSLKDTDIFHLLVFFLRLVKLHSNGRPRTRSCLAFLRTNFPLSEGAPKEESRIILP